MHREAKNYMLSVNCVRFWVFKYLVPWTVAYRITLLFMKNLVPSNHVIIYSIINMVKLLLIQKSLYMTNLIENFSKRSFAVLDLI